MVQRSAVFALAARWRQSVILARLALTRSASGSELCPAGGIAYLHQGFATAPAILHHHQGGDPPVQAEGQEPRDERRRNQADGEGDTERPHQFAELPVLCFRRSDEISEMGPFPARTLRGLVKRLCCLVQHGAAGVDDGLALLLRRQAQHRGGPEDVELTGDVVEALAENGEVRGIIGRVVVAYGAR